jgi:hypothetical protein
MGRGRDSKGFRTLCHSVGSSGDLGREIDTDSSEAAEGPAADRDPSKNGFSSRRQLDCGLI